MQLALPYAWINLMLTAVLGHLPEGTSEAKRLAKPPTGPIHSFHFISCLEPASCAAHPLQLRRCQMLKPATSSPCVRLPRLGLQRLQLWSQKC